MGAGVAAMLGMVRPIFVHFHKIDVHTYVDVGRPKDLSNSEVQWASAG